MFTVIAISLVFYDAFKKALLKRTFHQLNSVNILKKTQIEDYLDRQNNITILLHNPIFSQTLESFNPSNEQKINKDQRADLAEKIKQLMDEQHFTNLALLNENDSLVYISNEGNLPIQKIIDDKNKPRDVAFFLNKSKRSSAIIDLTNTLGKEKIMLLIGSPVLDENGKYKGLALLEKDNRFINYILHERSGMGVSGETYVVGNDTCMRSYSLFYPDKFPAAIKVNTPAAIQALQGKAGQSQLLDYRGIEVLSSYTQLNINGINWAIISEIDQEEAMQPIYEIRNFIVLIGLLISFLIVVITIILSRNISNPILKLHKIVLNLSKGILPKQKLEPNSDDEIGQITIALNELVEALKTTSHFAKEVGHGNFNANFTPLSQYDELGNALLQMRIDLKKLNEEKLDFIRQRSAALLEGEEKERKRLAREVHDGIGQMLTAIRLKLNTIEHEQETKNELKKMLDETTNEIKRISRNLMPNVLVDFGLKAAMDELIGNTSKYSNVPLDYSYNETETAAPISFDIAINVYRITQEAINNCFQYANATAIELKINVDNQSLLLHFRDNGKGFDVNEADKKKYNGIKNMEERIRLLNGKFNITSASGKGTTIDINIPLT